jgi:hypothetical protein
MTKDEELRQLIEDLISAMEYHVEQTRPIHSTTVALQAAREALKTMPTSLVCDCNQGQVCHVCDPITPPAQPSPVQPVGTYGEIHESMQALLRSGLQRDQQIYMAMKDRPLYTTPPAAPVPLTDEQIDEIVNRLDPLFLDVPQSFTTDFARAIEAAHGIRAIEAKLKEKNNG